MSTLVQRHHDFVLCTVGSQMKIVNNRFTVCSCIVAVCASFQPASSLEGMALQVWTSKHRLRWKRPCSAANMFQSMIRHCDQEGTGKLTSRYSQLALCMELVGRCHRRVRINTFSRQRV